LIRLGVDPLGNYSTEFAEMIESKLKPWAEAVEIAGVRQPAQ
jgi:hypothetical protein